MYAQTKTIYFEHPEIKHGFFQIISNN